jgi:hypothetical protein
MPNARGSHGIVNGHWEPSPPEPPKVVTLVRTGVTKLLQKISHHSETAADGAHQQNERHPPIAAE